MRTSNRRYYRDAYVCLLLGFFLSKDNFSLAAEDLTKNQTTLTGGVSHAEKLSPVTTSLSPEKIFNEHNMKTIEPYIWFEIPDWLAGTWRSIQIVRTEQTDDRSGTVDSNTLILTNRERERFGYQIDRLHKIWSMRNTLEPVVFTQEITEGKIEPSEKIPTTIYISRINEIISWQPARVQFRTIDLIVTVRNSDKKIEVAEKRESIRTFVPLTKNIIAVASDTHIYDQFGFPYATEKTVELKKREKEFTILDEWKGQSLYASFSKFLQKQGKIDAILERK